MMKPTEEGMYWWRSNSSDRWSIVILRKRGLGESPDELWGHCPFRSAHDYSPPNGPIKIGAVGQWLPIPTAEELVELQAIKELVDDDGFSDAYVVTSVSGRSVSIDFTEPRAWSLAERLEGIFRCDLESSGYTCRKVRVCKEVER